MPDVHSSVHGYVAIALPIVLTAVITIVRNRRVRRRLLFSALVALAAGGAHLAGANMPAGWFGGAGGASVELLLVALALANGAVAVLFNPWFDEQRPARTPSIVQDALVIVLIAVSAALIFRVSSFNVLTGSAIVAAIIGFALQETLGNAFAGIAIQIERPFRVGHWIAAGDHVGRVVEVTWRATKILTKAGNLTIVPNSQMASHAIQNYSEPTSPTRIDVDVGAAYGVPPNEVRDAMLAAMRQAKYVLADPPAEVLLWDFSASAITYRARFWIDDFSQDGRARSAVRVAVYYEFRRRGIEIPWPIQVEYHRTERPVDGPERRQEFRRAVAGVPVLAGLPDDAHSELAAAAGHGLYADGEIIVREGDAGASMFVVLTGTVVITVGADRREVAVTHAGGYFGEMSLLTGEPRTATVAARGDCTVLEIPAAAFRDYVRSRPEVLDGLALAAAARRRELDEARATAGPAAAATAASLRDRMRAFFGM